jgi:spore germination cell wall hydrolase CwlJ-like protein
LYLYYRTHAETRALNGAVLAGAALGLVVSLAYLLTAQLRLSADEARVSRLTDAAVAGYAAAPAAPAPAAIPTALKAAPIPSQSPLAIRPVVVTSRELDCLATAVYYEARGETAAGQAAVAQVVLNRARHPAYPKSVCAVVFQGATGHGCQFSFACNGAMKHSRDPGAWIKAREVAARALGGYVMTAVGKATAFHAARSQVTCVGRGPGSVQLGRQVFYTASAHQAAGKFARAPVQIAQAETARARRAAAATGLTLALGSLTPASPTADKTTASGGASPGQVAPETPSTAS